MRVTIAVAGLILLSLASGCACCRSKRGGEGPVKLYADDSGRTIAVSAGTLIYVTLDGNPTAGFTWEIEQIDPAVLTAQDHQFHPSSDMPGAGGVWVFSFECARPGRSRIRMIYHRPWEKVEPLRTFDVRVEVR